VDTHYSWRNPEILNKPQLNFFIVCRSFYNVRVYDFVTVYRPAGKRTDLHVRFWISDTLYVRAQAGQTDRLARIVE